MNTPALCPECGRPLPPAHEVCPSCLLAQGMATGTGGQAETNFPDLQEIQARFPQFEILECLGRGGMGIVYKARQKSLNRLVAIKVLAPEREHDSHFSARFSREAEILARLNHPHIVTIHDFGESGGLFYLVMEFVDGVNLREILSEGRMEPRQALAIVPEICDALQYAHDQGIVHRDIKPENILLDRSGRVKVADFGIAKLAGLEMGSGADTSPASPNLTTAGKVLGTPAYMAPEQMTEPDKVDHRADIYAVGAVFYQMLTGETPKGDTAPPSRKVAIDVRLDEIVLRALEKDPERRYQQVSEVRTRLDTLSSPAPPPLPSAPVDAGRSFSLRHLVISVAAFIGLSILIGGGVVGFLMLTRGPSQTPSQSETDYAWKLWNDQKFPEAREAFEKALKEDPKNANSWNGLGWALFHTGATEDAVAAFEKAVRLNPSMPGALNGLGQIALAKGDYRKAEEYLMRAAPMAPAAWFGLTRLYLLQGEYEKALPWAQKLADSSQGGEIAKELLEAAQKGNLDDKLRLKIAPQPADPNAAKEPPKLRALAWLDKPGDTWNAEGQRFSLAASGLPYSLITPIGMNISGMPYATKNPRFLCLWFSQATFDSLSVVRVELLGANGKPFETPCPDVATGTERPSIDTQGLGWLKETICAGTMTSTPDRVSITLYYSAGPWQFWDHLSPDFHGSQALANGVRLTPPFQSNDGRAAMQITRDNEFDTNVTQWDFVAITREGRRLERNGLSSYSSGNVRTEIFFFDAPLSQVVKFEIRKRPINNMSWPSVPLLSDQPITLEILADGTVRRGDETWKTEDFAQKLKALKEANPELAVIVRPVWDCPYERVKDVLNACAAAGIVNLAMTTPKAVGE
jgi:serine/threonine protein kinase/biopolymer transport protein ExbD